MWLEHWSNSQEPLLACELRWRSVIALAFQVNVTRVGFIVGSRPLLCEQFSRKGILG